MKHLRNLYIIIPAVVILSATVGFFITFPAAPHAAYARIFIDLGVLIALISAFMTVTKAPELPTDEITDAIRDLARGHYDTRLNSKNFEELNNIAQAFNELAGSLSESADPNINRLRYQYVRKENPEVEIQHSHHPELGPIEAVTTFEPCSPAENEKFTMIPTPHFVENSQVPESYLYTPEPPMADMSPAPNLSAAPVIQKSELEELYDHFCDAHKEKNKDPIDFDEFKYTIDRAREDLMAAHQCRSVRFEVVLEGSEVALRPRLMR